MILVIHLLKIIKHYLMHNESGKVAKRLISLKKHPSRKKMPGSFLMILLF